MSVTRERPGRRRRLALGLVLLAGLLWGALEVAGAPRSLASWRDRAELAHLVEASLAAEQSFSLPLKLKRERSPTRPEIDGPYEWRRSARWTMDLEKLLDRHPEWQAVAEGPVETDVDTQSTGESTTWIYQPRIDEDTAWVMIETTNPGGGTLTLYRFDRGDDGWGPPRTVWGVIGCSDF